MSTTDAVSINSLNIEEGSGYLATLVQSYVQPDAVLSQAQRDGDAPLATNVAPGAQEFILTVIVDSRAADADTIDARRRALLRELDTAAPRGPLTLTIKSAAGTPRERYMRFVCMKPDQVVGQYGEGFAARLVSADDVRWRSTTPVEVTQTFSEDGGTWVITCLGDLEAYPTYTITPRADRTAPVWPFFRPFILRWNSPWGGEHPVDITGGGLNTATIKTAGKVTNGTNMGVMLDGRYVPFWYGAADGQAGGFNSATTRMWINMTFQPATTASVTRYTSATDTTLYVRDDANLPQSGSLQIDFEYVTYTTRAPGVIYGVTRGQFGTTAEVHLAGDAVNPIHAGYIFYGPNGAVPAAARDYDYNNAKPPIFVNGSSTNSVWAFPAFHDTTKTVNWRYDWLGNSGTAFVSESAADGAYNATWVLPWTAMGFKPGWAKLSQFRRTFAVPVKRVRATGRRYAAGSASQWPSSPKLNFSNQMTGEFRTVWDSGQGIGRTPNPAFDVTTTDTTGAELFNSVSWSFLNTNFAQADIQHLYVVFRDEYLPFVEMGGEDTGYDLDMRLNNATTGEALLVEYPNMLAGLGMVIDSERMTAVYRNRSVYSAVRRSGDPMVRPRFLRLVPGSNTLQVQQDGIGSLEVKVSYEPRWYA